MGYLEPLTLRTVGARRLFYVLIFSHQSSKAKCPLLAEIVSSSGSSAGGS